jgi:hypothetical protein
MELLPQSLERFQTLLADVESIRKAVKSLTSVCRTGHTKGMVEGNNMSED